MVFVSYLLIKQDKLQKITKTVSRQTNNIYDTYKIVNN